MADTVLISNENIATVDTVTTLFTAPDTGSGTIITAFTVSNSSSASVSYKAYIVNSAGVVGDPVQPLKIVVKDRFDSVPSMVNQVVPPGGTIRAENSTANTLNFYATGRNQ